MSRNAAIVTTLPKPAADELRKVGLALRAARLERNEPQALLARRLGITPRTVRNAEKGDPRVSGGVFVSMLWALGLGPVGEDLVAQATKRTLGTGKVRARGTPSKSLDDF